MKLLRTVITVSGLTFLSRILGLIRDICFAAFLGAGDVADIFFVAFRLPNFFRRLFAEGALNAAFVPVFSRIYASQGLQVACIYAQSIYSFLNLALILFVIAFESALPWTIRALAPGFSHEPGKLRLTLIMSVLTFPYIYFISIAAFYGGILNSLGKFSAAAAHPIILNVVMILTVMAWSYFGPQAGLILYLSFGVLISGALQMMWMAYAAKRQNVVLIKKHSFKAMLSDMWNTLKSPFQTILTPQVRQLLRAMAPGALGAGVMQVNLFFDTLLASLLPAGAISYLYYADRLNQLPLSLLGVGISTVLLPALARHFEARNTHQVHALQNRALELTFFFVCPATVGLFMLAYPIISILFERSKFTSHDVMQTAGALQAYALGLPAYVLIKVLSTSFFAQYNTRTPVKIAICAVIFNIALTYFLMQPYGHVGIAAATAVTAWLNAFVLAIKLYQNRSLELDQNLKLQSCKILIASGILTVALNALSSWMQITSHITFPIKVFHLCTLVLSGGLIYLGALWILKGLKRNQFTILT